MTTLLLSLLLAFTEPKASHVIVGEVVAIADGDTLTVLDSEKVQHKIRLHGIDAPEKGQPFGTVARKAPGDKVHREQVRVAWKERDRYGRIVGDVYLDDRHINREMVADGFAWWYRKYAPKDLALENAESEVRKERRGLWRDREPVPPWEWRKSKRQDPYTRPSVWPVPCPLRTASRSGSVTLLTPEAVAGKRLTTKRDLKKLKLTRGLLCGLPQFSPIDPHFFKLLVGNRDDSDFPLGGNRS